MSELTQTDLAARGFLSPSPVVDAPKPFCRVSHVAGRLPGLIQSGASTLRKELEALPLLDTSGINDIATRRALLRDYLYLQSAYVNAPPQTQRIPAVLAVPVYKLAQSLKRIPMLTYTSVVSDNWRLDSEGAPFTLDHVLPVRTFTNTRSEWGFNVPHALIEHAGRHALGEIHPIIASIQTGVRDTLIYRLGTVKEALAKAQRLFAHITEHCEPDAYYSLIRPSFDGFRSVVFEGVEELNGVPQSFVGPSGAQSPLLPAVDAILSIKHESKTSRVHMPLEQAEFIQWIEHAPSLRAFVIEQKDARLRKAYNEAVLAVHSFRITHIMFIEPYITAHDPDAQGTGGSRPLKFLRQYIEDTLAAII